jgi:pyruvate kinase
MSHGEYSSHEKNIKNLRVASTSLNQEIAILMDLQGPKIRVEKIKDKNGVPSALILLKGEKWLISAGSLDQKLDLDNLKLKKIIPTSYKNLFKDVNKGDRVLFDDGLIQAVVTGKKITSKNEKLVEIEILVAGSLKSNKGINLPDSDVSAPSLTEKNKKDLIFGLGQDIDFIALSFVRNAKDILRVKEILKKANKNIPIISKIEKPEAIKNIEEIIEVSDGIMIARGDMAVEVGVHLVPKIQKQIIANQAVS